jgi:hypothetical protein
VGGSRKPPPLGVLLVLLGRCKNVLARVAQGPQHLAIATKKHQSRMRDISARLLPRNL